MDIQQHSKKVSRLSTSFLVQDLPCFGSFPPVLFTVLHPPEVVQLQPIWHKLHHAMGEVLAPQGAHAALDPAPRDAVEEEPKETWLRAAVKEKRRR